MKEFLYKHRDAVRALLIYTIGFGLAAFSGIVLEDGYSHGPGLSHIIILITVIIGLFKLIPKVFKFITHSPDQISKGAFLIHGIIAGGFLIWFLIDYYKIRNPKESHLDRSEILLIDDNKILLKDRFDDTSYYKVGEEVLIDKLESDSLK